MLWPCWLDKRAGEFMGRTSKGRSFFLFHPLSRRYLAATPAAGIVFLISIWPGFRGFDRLGLAESWLSSLPAALTPIRCAEFDVFAVELMDLCERRSFPTTLMGPRDMLVFIGFNRFLSIGHSLTVCWRPGHFMWEVASVVSERAALLSCSRRD